MSVLKKILLVELAWLGVVVFAAEEQLVVQKPLSWKIIVNTEIGYDVVEIKNETGTGSWDKKRRTLSGKTDSTNTNIRNVEGIDIKGRAAVGANVNLEPIPSGGVKADVSAGLDYGSKTTVETGIGNTKTKQTTESIADTIKNTDNTTTTKSNPHLTFHVELVNNTDEEVTCHLDRQKTRIPVIHGEKIYGDAHPRITEDRKISPRGKIRIEFRMDLKDSESRAVKTLMDNGKTPTVEITNSRDFIVDSKTCEDLVAKTLGCDTIKITMHTPKSKKQWEGIRRRNPSNGKNVTLREALKAADSICRREGNDYFEWNGKKLTKLSGVPVDSLAANDSEEHCAVFVQIGNANDAEVYAGITEKLLDQVMNGDITLWIVDLATPENYRKSPQLLQRKIFEKIKDLAEKTNRKEIQFRLAKMYHEGILTEKDEDNALSWFRKSAEQGLKDAQNKVCDIFTAGINLKSDTFSQSDIEHNNNMATLKKAFNSRRHQIEKTKRKLDELNNKYSGNNHINAECEKFKNYLDSMDKASFDCPEHKSKTWKVKCYVCGHKIWPGRIGGAFGIWRVCPYCDGAGWITRQEKCPNCGEMEKSKIPASQLIER